MVVGSGPNSLLLKRNFCFSMTKTVGIQHRPERVFEHLSGSMLIGMRKRWCIAKLRGCFPAACGGEFMRRLRDAECITLAAREFTTDFPERSSMSQMTKRHCDLLSPAGKTFCLLLCLMSGNKAGKCGAGKMT